VTVIVGDDVVVGSRVPTSGGGTTDPATVAILAAAGGAALEEKADTKGLNLNPSKARAIGTFGLSLLSEELASELQPGKARGFANLAAAAFSTVSMIESGLISGISFLAIVPAAKSGLGAPLVAGLATSGVGFGALSYANYNSAVSYLSTAFDDFSGKE
jgi:hypothetical protein